MSNRTLSNLIREYEQEEGETISRLDKVNKEINLQNNFLIKSSIEYVTNHLKDFINIIISDEEKKLLFHSIIKKIHVTQGSKPKERKIKEVIYHFTEKEVGLSIMQAVC